MPLPTEAKAPWPPKSEVDVQRDITEADAWYSGDSAKLTAFYGGPVQNGQQAQTGWSRFWTRKAADQASGRQRIHVPAAADVAATSADLLFGDEPRFVIPEAHEFNEQAEGDQVSLQANPEAKQVEERLVELAELDGWASTLLEGAEIAAALGGVYLRPAWDPTVADHPMLTMVHPDHAVPEWRWGQLVAVTFWREVLRDEKGVVWRHLERHERGVILHGLYAGDDEHLGISRPLEEHPETAALEPEVELPGGIRLDVRYVKNALNRKHRGKPVGRADTAGCEPLMDAIDETMTAWMREIRLVKPRIIVPNEFLDVGKGRGGRGGGKFFDVDAEVFAPLEMDPVSQDKAGITVAEFTLHTQDYSATCLDLFGRIVTTAGYSPQSFGMHGGGGVQGGGLKTATQVDSEDSKSNRTTARKQRYWQRPVEDVIEMLLMIDREVFGSKVPVMRPRLEYVDPDENSPREIGSTLNLIKLAGAASTQELVRMLHPDWEEPQILAEADRIKDENSLGVPDPTGGFPGAGPPGS